MIKGGYTSVDLSAAEVGGSAAQMEAGLYRKIYETCGKPIIITWGTYGETTLGFANKPDEYGDNIVITAPIVAEGLINGIIYAITSVDKAQATLAVPGE